MASVLAIGACATQAGTCAINEGEFGALLQIGAEIAITQFVNVVSDTIFFFLDNFLVRLTAA